MLGGKFRVTRYPEANWPGLKPGGDLPKGPWLSWIEIEWNRRIRSGLKRQIAQLTGRVRDLTSAG